jgi:transposase-like protein
MMQDTYHLSEIADMIGRPRATLFRWVQTYQEFIPTQVIGKTVKYDRDAVDIFNMIAELRDQNESPEKIKEFLRGLFPEREVAVAIAEQEQVEKVVTFDNKTIENMVMNQWQMIEIAQKGFMKLTEQNEQVLKRIDYLEDVVKDQTGQLMINLERGSQERDREIIREMKYHLAEHKKQEQNKKKKPKLIERLFTKN